MKKTALALASLLLLTACSAAPPIPSPTSDSISTPQPSTNNQIQDEDETPADKTPTSAGVLPRTEFTDFETTDIEGNTVTQEVFKDAKVTMVNAWATWCGPCVAELSSLQQLSDQYADKGFQLIGLVDSTSSMSDLNSLIEKKQLTYKMINWFDEFAALETGYVPTTYFFDADGRIIGSAFVGGKDFDEWSKVLDEMLADVG